MKAENLKDAFNNFTDRPLKFIDITDLKPGESPEFYVERKDSPLDDLKGYLLASSSDEKILFSGHLGSGKSTELNRLVSLPDIRKRFFLVKYSVKDELYYLDLHHIDLLISIAVMLYQKAIDIEMTFTSETDGFIKQFADDVSGKLVGYIKKEEGLSFFRSLLRVLKVEAIHRLKIREMAERSIGTVLEIINQIILNIQTELGERGGDKEILVIVDDLEKIPDINQAMDIFSKAGPYITAPLCKIIYTTPVALFYDVKFKEREKDVFSKSFFLPNIVLYQKSGYQEGPLEEGKNVLLDFIYKRMDKNLFEDEEKVTEKAIRNSGGLIRLLVELIRDACNKALSRGYNQIKEDIICDVIAEKRMEYLRVLRPAHIKILKVIRDCLLPKDIEADPQDLMSLFQARLILEYRQPLPEGGWKEWADILPIIAPILEK